MGVSERGGCSGGMRCVFLQDELDDAALGVADPRQSAAQQEDQHPRARHVLPLERPEHEAEDQAPNHRPLLRQDVQASKGS